MVILDDMPPKSKENVRQMLEKRVGATPEKVFLFSEADGRRWTYNEFDLAVNRAANMLLANHVSKGDVVSLLLPNSAEYIIAYFACWKIGALAGPVNSLLKPEEIDWVVGNSEAKLMLVGSEFVTQSGPLAVAGGSSEDSLEKVRASVPNKATISGNSPPVLGGVAAASADGVVHDAVANAGVVLTPRIVFDDISIADDFPDTLAQSELTPDDEAIIIYTSGTTGKPKGCLLTHGNLIANAKQITEWMGFGPNDRLLSVMPLFHMNAVSVTTITALYAGGSTVVSPKFSASRFWDIIEKYQITSFGSVATMLSMLLSKRDAESEGLGDAETSSSFKSKTYLVVAATWVR